MSEPFIGEIRMTGFNYAPVGWALCDGSLLPIAQNQALFALLGTQFGGNGSTTFGLPDLRGRVPLGPGKGAQTSIYQVGANGGSESVTLTAGQMPAHSHALAAASVVGGSTSPQNNFIAEIYDSGAGGATQAFNNASNGGTMNPAAIANSGGNQPHENRQPYLCVNFIIATQGIWPQRP